MNKLLHVKHYILFLLFIIPMVLSFYLGILAFSSGSTSLYALNSVITMIGLFILVLWIYTAGSHLCRLIKDKVNINIKFFRLNLIFISCFVLIKQTLRIIYTSPFEAMHALPTLLNITLIFYFLFSMIYCIKIVAKALVFVETGNEPTFSKYIKEFFAIWFFPIGIWWIQPRIQAIFKKSP